MLPIDMTEDTWPEFLYGSLTLDEYADLVRRENRNRKDEISALVRLIRDIAKYPYDNPEDTFKRLALLCDAIQTLLAME